VLTKETTYVGRKQEVRTTTVKEASQRRRRPDETREDTYKRLGISHGANGHFLKALDGRHGTSGRSGGKHGGWIVRNMQILDSW
jgi:hypothetical protein